MHLNKNRCTASKGRDAITEHLSLKICLPILFSVCGEFEYQCDMGMCIKSYQRCDGEYQCPDNSDEEKCGMCRCTITISDVRLPH